MRTRKIRNNSVGYIAELVYFDYAEARRIAGGVLEPESYFEAWMETTIPWCSDGFKEHVFSIFLKYLMFTAGKKI